MPYTLERGKHTCRGNGAAGDPCKGATVSRKRIANARVLVLRGEVVEVAAEIPYETVNYDRAVDQTCLIAVAPEILQHKRSHNLLQQRDLSLTCRM